MLLSRGACLASLLVGCQACVEAAGDAGLLDAGWDAGHDAGIDAGYDAGRDAGRDAGTAGWTRLPGLPDECAIERAEHPEVLFRPEWAPCAEQPVGCLREVPRHAVRTEVGWHDGARGFVALGSSIVDLDRGTIAAWRAPPQFDDPWVCSVHAIGIGDGYGAMYANFHHFGAEERSLDHVYHAPLDEIGAIMEPVAVIAPGFSSTPQHLAVSRSLVAAEMQPVGATVLFARGRWMASSAEPVVGIPQHVDVVGDYAFWEDWGSTVRIAIGALDRAPVFLRDIAPGRTRSFHTDGVDLAWVEIFDEPPSLELVTAPVVFEPSELAPRRLGPIESIQLTGMGGGWYARVIADPERVVLTELASGRTKTWRAPEGELLSPRAPVYVTATEVLLWARLRDATQYWVRIDPRVLPWD